MTDPMIRSHSPTSESSHDTSEGEHEPNYQELYYKYMAKCAKLRYKACREFLKAGERLEHIEKLSSSPEYLPAPLPSSPQDPHQPR